MILYFNFNFFLGSLLPFVIGLFVLLKNKRKTLNRTFFMLSLCGAEWSFGLLLMMNSKTYQQAYLWRLVMDFGAILLPAFWLHFVFSLLNISKIKKNVIYINYFTASILCLINILDLFIPGIFIKELVSKSVFNYYPTAGFGYYLFLFYYIILIPYSIIYLIKYYQKSSGYKAQQIKYILLSSFFAFGGGCTAFLLTFNILFPPLGIIFVTFYPLLIAYSIIRYRLMDIRTIIKRSTVFALLIFIIGTLYIFLSFIIINFLEIFLKQKSQLFISIIFAVIISIGFSPLKKLLEDVTNKYLFAKEYNPDTLLSQISEVTASILNFQQLLASISGTLDDTFHCGKIAVALLDKNGRLYLAYQQGFDQGVMEKFAAGKEKILPKYFSDSREIQVIDELKTRYEAGDYQPKSVELLEALYDMDIGLVIPLFVKEKLTGLFVLGNKKSGDPYNHQDLNVLKIIAGQSAIAIENATLYDELKDFNIKLEDEVKRKTAELRKANEELKQLDAAKSEFISIASHQLRTPLSVIKGYVSMIQEGSFGPVPPTINVNLKKVYDSNERLINLVDNLLDISRIESGRQEFEWKKVRLETMAQTVVDNLKNNAKAKGLKLFFLKPPKPTPLVNVDVNKLHEVMMNFVDNAIKYTKEGEVSVSIAPEPKDMVTFCVQDTGMGIAPEIKPLLFKKFSRGKGSFRIHTEGLGLGLYVAKIMVDAQHGKIWAESDGVGKGSKFCFSLPVAEQKPK